MLRNSCMHRPGPFRPTPVGSSLAKLRLRSQSRTGPCPAAAVRTSMPIFPLSLVAFPSATVPLMIFEARYRVLFNTLLAGEPKVEEGLVNTDSPYVGTKRFGMCFIDGGRMNSIGTILEIVDFAQLEDGRLFVTAKCQELAMEVSDLLRNTIRLNQKMNNIQATEDQLEPEELAGLGPRELSYWMMSFFSDFNELQQKMLEENSIVKRLQKEKEVLTETVNYFAAQSALKSAFNSSDSAPPAPSTPPASSPPKDAGSDAEIDSSASSTLEDAGSDAEIGSSTSSTPQDAVSDADSVQKKD
eukprot:gene24705-10341_t